MRILVTGAAGFVGRHVAEELHAHGHVVAATDLQPGCGDESDLTDSAACHRLMGEYTPDVVIHLAAQVGRVFGEDDLKHTITANVVATANLARAVSEAGARMLYVSTSEVYGDQGNHVCHEYSHLSLPHNLYGLSKLWGEEACKLYCPDGLQVVRLSMPYGTGVAPGRGRAAITNVMWQAATGQPIPIHRGAERSWCHISDIVAGIRLVVERGETSGAPDDDHSIGVYNVGRDDDAVSMLALAYTACDMVGASRNLIDVVDPPNAQTVVKRLSTDKLRRLGWTPKVSLEEGLPQVLAWVRNFDAAGERTTAKV